MNSSVQKAESLISNVDFENEYIYTGNNGEYLSSEVLSRFKDENIIRALNILKNTNSTTQLLLKVLNHSFEKISKTNESMNVNAYLKDLENPNLIDLIYNLDNYKHIDTSKIIIEILEDDYGKLSDIALKNIKKLKNMGFKISIDDLTIYNHETSNNISVSNLLTLLNNGVIPEFVKIDGSFLQKIIDEKISEKLINNFKEMIKYLKGLGIKIIGEWIQDEHDGKAAKELGIELFQGRDLKRDFNIETEDITNDNIIHFDSSISGLNAKTISLFSFFRRKLNKQLELVAA